VRRSEIDAIDDKVRLLKERARQARIDAVARKWEVGGHEIRVVWQDYTETPGVAVYLMHGNYARSGDWGDVPAEALEAMAKAKRLAEAWMRNELDALPVEAP
jgi:hypothetical protein